MSIIRLATIPHHDLSMLQAPQKASTDQQTIHKTRRHAPAAGWWGRGGGGMPGGLGGGPGLNRLIKVSPPTG